MNLLPRTVHDFKTHNYWDDFFRRRGADDTFEWYGEYSDICGILHKYARPQHNILVVGCGSSGLSETLYDVGYRSVTNIDISEVVIQQMVDRNVHKRPDMTFVKMDAAKMDFSDACYDVAIDKGTLDALCVDESEEVVTNVVAMFDEIGRVLKAGGRYVCVSLCQEHVMKRLIDAFAEKGGWFVRVHKVVVVSGRNEEHHGLPVFAFVMTKAKPGLAVKVLEVCLDGCDRVIRVDSAEQFQEEIKSVQQYAMLRQYMQQYHPGEEFQMTFWCNREDSIDDPRYTVIIVDSITNSSQNGKYAAFIVPQGRENEWLFASPEGRSQLTVSSGFQRLAIASLHRGQTYESLQAVKEELSGSVMELAPLELPPKQRVLFLSVGDDVGQRTVIFNGISDFSGKFVIEDVTQEDKTLSRRLIFLSNPNVVQSEARLIVPALPGKGRKKKGKKKTSSVKERAKVDINYLSCTHHKHIISGLAWLRDFGQRGNRVSLLVVGLGGGSLVSFIDRHLIVVSITVVEIDPSMLDVATNWFGFSPSSRTKVVIEDGLKYLETMASSGPKFDAVVFDVDSKDKSLGVSCPPLAFFNADVLENVQALLKPGGIFILNLVCRDVTFKHQAYENITATGFHTILSLPVLGEVNEVVVALTTDPSTGLEMENKPAEASKDSDDKEHLKIPDWVVDNVKCIDRMIRDGRGKRDESSSEGNSLDIAIDLSAPLERLKLATTSATT